MYLTGVRKTRIAIPLNTDSKILSKIESATRRIYGTVLLKNWTKRAFPAANPFKILEICRTYFCSQDYFYPWRRVLFISYFLVTSRIAQYPAVCDVVIPLFSIGAFLSLVICPDFSLDLACAYSTL